MIGYRKLPRREQQIVRKGKDSHRCTVMDIVPHEDGRLWGWIRGGHTGRVQVKHLRGRYWEEVTKAKARAMAGGGK